MNDNISHASISAIRLGQSVYNSDRQSKIIHEHIIHAFLSFGSNTSKLEFGSFIETWSWLDFLLPQIFCRVLNIAKLFPFVCFINMTSLISFSTSSFCSSNSLLFIALSIISTLALTSSTLYLHFYSLL